MVLRAGSGHGDVWPRAPRVEVWLTVGGDVDPVQIRRILEPVLPAPSAGERAPAARWAPVEERWSRVLVAADSWSIEPLLEQAATALEPVTGPIARLREDSKAWVGLMVVAHVDPDHPRARMPDLALAPELLGWLHDLGVDVVIDYRQSRDWVGRAD